MAHDDVMTPAQRDLLTRLATDVYGTERGREHLDKLRAENPQPTRGQASAWIDELKSRQRDRPAAPRGRGGLPTVPAGRYAIAAADGEVYTYKVDRPSDGKFAGWTFVSWIRNNGYESRLPMIHAKKVLAAIAEDPKGALVAYGRRTGSCGLCGRKLTDPESVELGIGPICLSKL